jgi:hypothetical protein
MELLNSSVWVYLHHILWRHTASNERNSCIRTRVWQNSFIRLEITGIGTCRLRIVNEITSTTQQSDHGTTAPTKWAVNPTTEEWVPMRALIVTMTNGTDNRPLLKIIHDTAVRAEVNASQVFKINRTHVIRRYSKHAGWIRRYRRIRNRPGRAWNGKRNCGWKNLASNYLKGNGIGAEPPCRWKTHLIDTPHAHTPTPTYNGHAEYGDS